MNPSISISSQNKNKNEINEFYKAKVSENNVIEITCPLILLGQLKNLSTVHKLNWV